MSSPLRNAGGDFCLQLITAWQTHKDTLPMPLGPLWSFCCFLGPRVSECVQLPCNKSGKVQTHKKYQIHLNVCTHISTHLSFIHPILHGTDHTSDTSPPRHASVWKNTSMCDSSLHNQKWCLHAGKLGILRKSLGIRNKMYLIHCPLVFVHKEEWRVWSCFCGVLSN